VSSTIDSDAPTLFMEIHTYLLKDEPIVVKFFDLDSLYPPSISIAPTFGNDIFMMGPEFAMHLTTSNNRSWLNSITAKDGKFLDMHYNQGSALHFLQIENSDADTYMSVLKFNTGLNSE